MDINKLKEDVVFLVTSCDEYSDLWIPFAKQFTKYWPDCPFDKYFSSNQIPFNDYGFTALAIGEYKTWSINLQNMLCQLKEKYKYVLIVNEDALLLSQVDTKYVLESIDEFIGIDGFYLNFAVRNQERGKKVSKEYNQYFRTLKKDIPYRTTCVYCLWKIDALLSLLDANETGWDFERQGSARATWMDGFYISNIKAFNFLDGVHKGKWGRKELAIVKAELPDIVITREIFTEEMDKKYRNHARFFHFFMTYIPLRLQKPILKILGRR
jgi:hypothetical protein